MIEVGKRYYFICDPYYHFIGEVTAVLGIRRVACREVVQVHSSNRNWTQFFAQGAGTVSRIDTIGTTADMAYLVAHDWPHPIPQPSKERRP